MQIQVVSKTVGLLNATLTLTIGNGQNATVIVSLDDAKLINEGDTYPMIINTL